MEIIKEKGIKRASKKRNSQSNNIKKELNNKINWLRDNNFSNKEHKNTFKGMRMKNNRINSKGQ
jgi:hypothetical protein